MQTALLALSGLARRESWAEPCKCEPSFFIITDVPRLLRDRKLSCTQAETLVGDLLRLLEFMQPPDSITWTCKVSEASFARRLRKTFSSNVTRE